LTYDDASSWSETIGEVVSSERMPPWSASPQYGAFANDPRLTDHKKRLLDQWIQAGCPESSPADLPPAPVFTDGWAFGKPDLIVPMPQPFTVPADGVIDYQYFTADPKLEEDIWVSGIEVHPSNRSVVHHATIFLVPPGMDEPAISQGELGSYCLIPYAPGTPPLVFPDGMAKRIPAGWRIHFVMHYTPVGSIESDQTSIGLQLADPKKVKQEVATKLLVDETFRIPPNETNFRIEQTFRAPKDLLLLAMFPHMHLRGKSFRYEAEYPDGSREILLDVPRYDFNWQHRYELAKPKLLPAGTTLHCTATYDNSSSNPVNPNPNVEVRPGKQNWDEMFNAYFDIVLADQDLSRPQPWYAALLSPAHMRTIQFVLTLLAIAISIAFLFLGCWLKRPL
jgi:hypothetical protein